MHKKGVIYTCIFGYHDRIKSPRVYDKTKYDYICFTDLDDLKSDVWDIRRVAHAHPDINKAAKYPKICAHLFLPEYEYSMYIDGNMTLKVVPDIEKLLGPFDIVNEKHRRKSVFEEAAACLCLRKGKREEILRQIKDYISIGVSNKLQVRCNWILIRRHNKLKDLQEKWWQEVVRYSSRDQISFPWVFRDVEIGNLSSRERIRMVDINYLHG